MNALETLDLAPIQDSAHSGQTHVRRYCLFFLCALVGLWLFSLAELYIRLHLRHSAFDSNSIFFVHGQDRFRDFTAFNPASGRYAPPGFSPLIPYPPASEGVFLVFTRILGGNLTAYLIFVAISGIAAAFWFARRLCASAGNRWLLAGVVAAATFLSYPFLFLLERANFEGFIWIAIAAGLTAFTTRRYKTAAILFGLCAAMKMYPGVLVLLLLSRKRYKEIALAGAASAVFTVIGLGLLGPSVHSALAEFQQSAQAVAPLHVLYHPTEIRYDHSIFSLVKQVLFLHYGDDDASLSAAINLLARPYVLTVLCALPVLYWFRIRKLPLSNQVIALITIAITFPHMSLEYTLNHQAFCFAVFLLFLVREVATGRESIAPWAAYAMLSAFAFIFALGPFGLIAGQLKLCALLTVLLIAVTVPLRSALLDGSRN